MRLIYTEIENPKKSTEQTKKQQHEKPHTIINLVVGPARATLLKHRQSFYNQCVSLVRQAAAYLFMWYCASTLSEHATQQQQQQQQQ